MGEESLEVRDNIGRGREEWEKRSEKEATETNSSVAGGRKKGRNGTGAERGGGINKIRGVRGWMAMRNIRSCAP